MNNNFDNLAKLALNEASLSEYMKAAGRAVGRAASVAGSAYSYLGGTQGGAILKTVGKGLQKISVPSDVAALQSKKALPKKGETVSLITPSRGKTRFTVKQVTADKKRGINVIASSQGNTSGKYDQININVSGENGLQSGTATVTFMQGNTLSSVKPIQVSTKRTDINDTSTWQLIATGTKRKSITKQSKLNRSMKVKQQTTNKKPTPPTSPTAPVQKNQTNKPAAVTAKGSTQTKYGAPVAPPSAAAAASMNLPQHPLTNNTPINKRK
jgi:hypothetical protein